MYMINTQPRSGILLPHSVSMNPLFFLCTSDTGVTPPLEPMREVKQELPSRDSGRTRASLERHSFDLRSLTQLFYTDKICLN